MPGIFGFFANNGVNIEQPLKRMAAELRPEIEGVSDLWVDRASGAGLGREALNYFLSEPQPVVGRNGIRLIAHGEVRQAEQIRRNLLAGGQPVEGAGICELLLASYLNGGIDTIAKINGSVAAAIWNPETRKLILFPDRYGMRPIFYTYRKGVFAFASEMKALLALGAMNLELDEAAVMELLTLDMIGADRTFIKSIRRLPFGSVLTYQDGLVRVDDRWKLEFRLPQEQRTDEDYLEEFIEILKDAVSERLNDPRAAIALSGGLDSRFLLALAVDRGLSVPCVTYGTKGSRDLTWGKKTARAAGVHFEGLVLEDNYLQKFAEQMISRVDGLINAFSCHAMSLLRIADRYPILALGNGIDQLLYTTRSEYGDLLSVDNIIEAFYHNRNRYIPEASWGKVFTPDWLKVVNGSTRGIFYEDVLNFRADCIDNQLDSYMMQHLANSTMSGLSSISHRLEFTEPFFDYRLVEFGLRLPVKLRWKRALEIMALERISPRLSEVIGGSHARVSSNEKWIKTIRKKSKNILVKLGLLNPAYLRPPSSTFADVHDLLRKRRNKQWLRNLLLSPRSLERGIFRPEKTSSALDEHFSGLKNHTSLLGAMVSFELVMDRVLNNRVDSGMGVLETLPGLGTKAEPMYQKEKSGEPESAFQGKIP